MAKIFVTRPIPTIGLELLRKDHEVVIHEEDAVLSKEDLISTISGKNYEAIITLLTDKVDDSVLEAAGPQLKIIANYAVGFDNIDLEAAKKRNIFVTNTPGAANQAVAEHTITLMLALAKSVVAADSYIRNGKYTQWEPKLFLGPQVSSKTLGIIGVGNIGKTVVQMASLGFNMKVIYNDIAKNDQLEMIYKAKFSDVPNLMKQADFVVVLVPLLPSTKHLINAEKLAMMKKTAYLINTSRGPIVDEQALVEALKNKLIAGAALDVFENEPQVHPDLLTMENVVLTPHIASATIETRDQMSKMVALNVAAALAGQTPPNPAK